AAAGIGRNQAGRQVDRPDASVTTVGNEEFSARKTRQTDGPTEACLTKGSVLEPLDAALSGGDCDDWATAQYDPADAMMPAIGNEEAIRFVCHQPRRAREARTC